MVAECPPRATIANESPSATISCNPCEVIAPGEVGTVGSLSMAFSANDPVANIRPVYEGAIALDGSITWSLRTTAAALVGLTTPVRIAPHGSTNSILQYDEDDPDAHLAMFGYDSSTFYIQLENTWDFNSDPSREEFDLHSSGLSIVSWGDSNLGQLIRVSTDYGRTWSPATVVDGLYTKLHALSPGIEYEWFGATLSDKFSVQVDEDTGTFYLLMPYALDSDTFDNVWGLWKSSTGAGWTLVNEWGESTYPFKYSGASLAVSNGYIYVGFAGLADGNVHVMHSSNGGVTWQESVVSDPESTSVYSIALAAHDGIAILYWALNFKDLLKVYRTVDGGANWTVSLRLDYGDNEDLYPFYPNVRASGDLFLVTLCNVSYPTPAHGAEVNVWTANGVAHDMTGADQAFLCFWLSLDAGATWDLRVSPLAKRDLLGTPLYWQQSLDASAIAGQVVTSVSLCPPEGTIVTDSPYATIQCEECVQ